jgi:hypothetical protein
MGIGGHGRSRTLRRWSATATAAVVAVVGASLAWAASTATIGSNLKPQPDNTYGCDATCTIMQTTLEGEKVKAPFDGTIEQWRIRKGPIGEGDVYEVRLWVVRRAGDEWEFVRRTQARTIEAPAGKYKFPAHLRIEKRDRIAVEFEGGSEGLVRDGNTDTLLLGFDPAPSRGEVAAPDYTDPGFEAYWNVTIARD